MNDFTTGPIDDANLKRRWRPSRAGWWVVVAFAVVGMLPSMIVILPSPAGATPLKPTDYLLIFGMFTAPTWLIAGVLSIYLARFEITTDDDHLCWRGFGKWRCAGWREVSDYYDAFLHGRPGMVIVTPAGLMRPANYLANKADVEEFQALVQRNATQARGVMWDILGARSEDEWPHVFQYDRHIVRDLQIWSLSLLAMVGAVPVLLLIKIGDISQAFRFVGWNWWLGLSALIVFFAVTFILLIVGFASLLRAARLRRNDRISINQLGLAYQGDDKQVAATWDEVSDYFTQSVGRIVKSNGCYVVVTKHGTFDFLFNIKDAELLKLLIARHAMRAAHTSWELSTKEKSPVAR